MLMRFLGERNRQRFAAHCVLLLVGMGLFGYVSCRRGKEACGDLYHSHYYNVYMLLHGRIDYDIAPVGLHTFINPVFDLPFYSFVHLFQARTVGFLMGAIHGINLWLLYLLAKRVLAGERGWKPAIAAALALACTAAGLYSPMVVAEVGTVFNDLIGSLFIFGALYVLLGVYQSVGGIKAVACAGVLVGCVVGGKLTHAIYLPAFVALSLMTGNGWRGKLTNATIFGLALGIGFLLTNGYWMYLLYTRLHNPLFPFYNKLFRSDYFPQVNFSDTRFGPKTWADALLFPYTTSFNHAMTAEVPYRDWRYFIAFLALGVAVIRVDTAWRKWKAGAAEETLRSVCLPLTVFFFVTYVVWMYQFGIVRYAVGLEMIAPLLIVVLLLRIMPRQAPALGLGLACLAVIAAAMKPADWGRDRIWTKHYFEDELPSLAANERAFVIVACQFPCTHLLPMLPQQTRFANPAALETFYPAVREALRTHNGSVYLLTNSQATDYCKRCLNMLGMQPQPGSTRVLKIGICSRPVTVEWVRLRGQESGVRNQESESRGHGLSLLTSVP